MNIIEIKNKLENIKYLCKIFEEENHIIVGTSEEEGGYSGLYVRKNVCSVKLKNKNITIEYFKGQIPLEREFDNIDDMIKFVKKQFPL